MQLKIAEVLKIYNKLRMVVREGRKHTIANLFYEGKFIFTTRVSRGKGEIGDANIVNAIRRQFFLSESNFIRLKDCSLNYEEYIEILKSKGKI